MVKCHYNMSLEDICDKKNTASAEIIKDVTSKTTKKKHEWGSLEFAILACLTSVGQCFLAINQNIDQPAFEKPWMGNKWQISCLPFWWIYGGFLKMGLPPVIIHFCLGFSMKETNQLLGILHLYPFWLVVWNIFFSIIYGIILPINFHIFQDG